MYEGGELRKRTGKITQLNPIKDSTGVHSWSHGNGQFYDFQQNFKRSFPGTRFENEFCEDGVTECSLTGYTGTVGQLKRWETHEVTFEVYDGRVVVKYTKGAPRRPIDWTIPAWIMSALLLLAFIYLNIDSYAKLLG